MADDEPTITDRLREALIGVGNKPADTAEQKTKKRYSEEVSQAIALALADELRARGMKEARPAPPSAGKSGAERRVAGGAGGKKVDVTWATEEAGLMLAISVKSINFRSVKFGEDEAGGKIVTKEGSFQKNLTNRRGDIVMEALTLHRRFPYAVLVAFFLLDADAATDSTDRRKSTFQNAHQRLKLFTGRDDPAGREEQFETFYLVLIRAGSQDAELTVYEVGEPDDPVPLEAFMDRIVLAVVERNPDFYEEFEGKLKRI